MQGFNISGRVSQIRQYLLLRLFLCRLPIKAKKSSSLLALSRDADLFAVCCCVVWHTVLIQQTNGMVSFHPSETEA